eukprot:14675-Heterococcus_DN1.PRE.6
MVRMRKISASLTKLQLTATRFTSAGLHQRSITSRSQASEAFSIIRTIQAGVGDVSSGDRAGAAQRAQIAHKVPLSAETATAALPTRHQRAKSRSTGNTKRLLSDVCSVVSHGRVHCSPLRLVKARGMQLARAPLR